ncbi:uncharacterized protein LOC126656471 [Mercurialis annua]|uniref:uncharacterized protein LOC126656471 n=1 Tax=Mercurialis annua TaxID=3986 RepID=UPI002160B494|nr:uncharacterized protein LOC126656471 [Mercurialis annua]
MLWVYVAISAGLSGNAVTCFSLIIHLISKWRWYPWLFISYAEFSSLPPTVPTSSPTTMFTSAQVSWLPPPLGFIKVNFDVATSSMHHCGFIAAVARDSNGFIINRFHAYYRHIWDPSILEFRALRESINWALSCCWYHVIFEGDALQTGCEFGRCFGLQILENLSRY